MMNFTIIEQILKKYAYQFIEDGFCYYTEKYDSFTNLKSLSSREKEVIAQEAYDMFQELNHKITLPFYCTLTVQSIINSHTSYLLINQKHYTKKLLWLTFRPSDEMDINRFKDITIKLLDKEIIQSYIIVYEQKGNSYANLGKGKHFHAIIQFYFKSEFKTYKQQIKKYFKDLGMIKLVDIDKTNFIIDKLVYIGLTIEDETGLLITQENLNYKKKEKNDRLQYDRLFQRKNNLEFQTKNEMEILGLCGLSIN